ncbi:unnamed protein product [Protopolystoma xenopodis]|uniref:CUE domain-containing protein n=1 Tax=Protopolystoma xenopodis TaxID=117903 RepID=A0A3S4ZI82_9PLAT|nr:unnamed protein product [Protopolystoma xenopodis]
MHNLLNTPVIYRTSSSGPSSRHSVSRYQTNSGLSGPGWNSHHGARSNQAGSRHSFTDKESINVPTGVTLSSQANRQRQSSARTSVRSEMPLPPVPLTKNYATPEQIAAVKEIFPNIPEIQIQQLLIDQRGDTGKVVEFFLNSTQSA